MSVLAHVFEAAGLATVVLSSMKDVVQLVAPPRALHCQFPLGRPLGKPLDADFQTDVLMRAFATLAETSGPALHEHPEVIEASEEPIACQMPARFDPNLPAAVDEANGMRKAYDRSVAKRGTSVGRSFDADGVPAALDVFHQIVEGAHWKDDVKIPGKNTVAAAHDIRTYYEEAALELVEGPPPGGRAAEAWFFETTEAGKTMLAARKAMEAQGAPFGFWFYMAPGHR